MEQHEYAVIAYTDNITIVSTNVQENSYRDFINVINGKAKKIGTVKANSFSEALVKAKELCNA